MESTLDDPILNMACGKCQVTGLPKTIGQIYVGTEVPTTFLENLQYTIGEPHIYHLCSKCMNKSWKFNLIVLIGTGTTLAILLFFKHFATALLLGFPVLYAIVSINPFRAKRNVADGIAQKVQRKKLLQSLPKEKFNKLRFFTRTEYNKLYHKGKIPSVNKDYNSTGNKTLEDIDKDFGDIFK